MALHEFRAAGRDYLELITALLQRARHSSPLGGLWEAADLQWWWRRDQHADPARQVFWFEGETPVAAVVLTDWGNRIGCDLISAEHDLARVMETVWPVALGLIAAVDGRPVEIIVGDDDPILLEAVTAAGFLPTGGVGVATWMDAAVARDVPALPAGFRLSTRSDARDQVHHLAARNGPAVAARLAECSLYHSDLDLAVLAPDAELAAYGLFWADPTTGVGLVEPMRTDDCYQGMGLGRVVLASGVRRLAERGCSRLKVSYIVGNEASRRLYLGAGFEPHSTACTYGRPA